MSATLFGSVGIRSKGALLPGLLLCLLLATVLGGCSPKAPPRSQGGPMPMEPRQFSQSLLNAINDYRLQQGQTPLAWDEHLASLAQAHTAHMDQTGKLSHDGFQQRFEGSGAGVCVENTAWNKNTPQAVLDGWRASLPYDRNLLRHGLSRAGIARVGYFVTFFACD